MTKKSKYDMPAVQNFAFGGIANPSQRAFLRSSDKSYLDARQKELDAFEQQRLAYNDQLTKWQTEVYNPYKAQVDAYNAASEKYNTDVYNPYKAQVDAYNAAAEKYNTDVYNPYKSEFQKYQEAVDAYNAGDRLTDYAGPAEPKLASEFTMAAPTQPTAFEMATPTTPEQFKGVAPTLPFKEEEVVARQQEAAGRARKDASNRAVAIDVVSNPDQFNFGSMSVSNRFMAKGGEVMQDDPSDRAASSIIKDFEGYGYTREEIMELADKVAAAGRGGDELLAYLSPESVEYLKANGGSGTINPITGLPEFKGGVIGKVVNAVKKVFGGGSRSPAPAVEPADAPIQTPASLPSRNRGVRLDAETSEVQDPQPVLQRRNTAAQDLQTITAAPTPPPPPPVVQPPVVQPPAATTPPPAVTAPAVASTPTPPVLTPPAVQPPAATTPPPVVGTAKDLLLQIPANQVPAAPTPAPTPAVVTPPPVKAAPPSVVTPTPPTLTQPPVVAPTPVRPTPRDRLSTAGFIQNTIGPRSAIGGPASTVGISAPNVSFTPVSAATPLAQLNLRGRITSPTSKRAGSGGSGSRTTAQAPSNSSGGDIPIYRSVIPDYSSRGVGAVGSVGSIPIFGPSGPSFVSSPIGRGGAATSPSSYFAMTPQTSTGLAPGSAAIGPADMPIAAGRNTLGAIAANPNLSPMMLGGQQNAGVMRDRLGNQIYAPGAGLFGPPGFAKGGDVSMADIMAMNTETLSDEKPDEVINTDPVGTAQQMLTALGSAGKASPTRQSIKRVKTSGGGGASADKGMQMAYEDLAKSDLGSMKDRAPAARNTESARAQMEELARVYQMKIRSAQNAARGLAADTLGAPTLEQPTLTKGSLTKKRFKDGGEAKKTGAQEIEEPGVLRVTSYSTDAAERMFPGQMGQDDQRDAARHMLAAATMAKKFGPGPAEFLGKAHERLSNPESFFSMFGIGKPRDDYEMDVHNNKLGAELAARSTSQAELEKLVRAMAMQAQNKQTEGKPWTMSKEQMKNRKGQITTQPPEYRADGSPAEGERAPEVTGVNRVLDFIAQRMPAESFPTSARTLLETVQGKKEPITESNFSPKELNVLRQLIESTGGRGNVQYDDYTNFMKRQQQEKGTIPASIAPNVLSMLDPIGNVQTTLGRFTYASDGDGNLVVTDKYDFNPIRSMSGAYGALRNYAAEKIPPGKGRDVRINLGKTVKRADGSPEEGEIGPAFVTPKSGKGRKEGEISRQLKSGEAYTNMAKGVTELPYDIAGAPVDLATMLLRPFGYSTEKPVMGSDFIKEKMTKLGVRPEPPADPTAKGFYTAGELLSNLTNPAAVSRKVGPAVEKGVKAGAMEVGRQLDRAILDNAGPLAKAVPQAAKPLYAVRPTGSTMFSGPVGMEEGVSKLDQVLRAGMSNATVSAGSNDVQAQVLKDFWDKKARNYFTRQFGTPDDPIATAISKKQIKGTALDELFPEYLIDQLNVGKTRVNDQGQERFFPKYPRAMEDFTSRYDKATGLKGSLITTDPAAASQRHSNLLSDEGKLQGLLAETAEQDKLLAQGVRPELINTDVGTVTRSAMDYDKIIGDGADSAKALFRAYQEASKYDKMSDAQKTDWINQVYGEGRRIMGKTEEEVGKNLLAGNVKTAIDKGEPVYDVDFMRAPLTELFSPTSITNYLASIPVREAANIRFEDAVKGALKMKEKTLEMQNIAGRIKSGKPVADSVFSKGVSAPLVQIDNGPLEGYAWKRIEKREATVPEGAYVGHSVGGYETGGIGYSSEKMDGFNTGKWQVYTLRDNRNRPVNTIEVQMVDEFTPVVMQIKGNGRATGNTAPEKYDSAVLQFFQDYLRPAAIKEKDEYLTPLLQTYKEGVNSTFKMP